MREKFPTLEIFFVRSFPHSDCLILDTEKYGPEKILNCDTCHEMGPPTY